METIKKGSQGPAVEKLQELLGMSERSCVFCAATEAALVEYQATHGLSPDGICGPKSWASLLTSTSESKPATIGLSLYQLGQIMPTARTSGRAAKYIDALNEVMAKYKINTPLRMAHFLAQVAHESGELRYNEELASGAAYDTGKKAIALGNTPQADGDGQRYKGRGLIQLTGRANYAAFAKATGCDCVNHPELVAQIPWCVETAGWYWNSRNINAAADIDAFVTVTRLINGGTNGKASRKTYLNRAKKVFRI